MTKKACGVDLFCGAGGTSAGAEATGEVEIKAAVNHWDVAVRTHSRNFPHTRHIQSRLDMVNPNVVDRCDWLFASPECTHHSRARGGRPTSDQQRSGAWDLMRWIEYHRPSRIIVENVREFEQWGPVHAGRPMRSRRGKFFEAWIAAIRGAGYSVDWQVLNAADVGAATSRDRLFIVARKGKRSPRFPEGTHSKSPVEGGLRRWRAAAEVIDWSIPCPSIFNRVRPLADKTLLRIEAGLRRFVGPFVVQFDNHRGSGLYCRGAGSPLPTLVTKANCAFVVPNFGERGGQPPRTHDLNNPAPTATSRGAGNLCVPLVMSGLGGGVARDISGSIPTITARCSHSLIAPFLSSFHGGSDSARRNHSLEESLPTQDTSNRYGLAVPFLTHYYGTDNMSPVSDPLDTITTRDRHGIALAMHGPIPRTHFDESLAHCWDSDLRGEFQGSAMGNLLRTMHELGVIDIGFRMLANHELAAAQGFPADYYFAGNKSEVTRQIGNSVSPPQAQALTAANAA